MEELTGHQFDVESESFQLRNIMEAPLLKFREDIEVSVRLSFVQDLSKLQQHTTFGPYNTLRLRFLMGTHFNEF